ncbi:putative ribonuclease H-like domain-containing protein [Tanacetum coccineum]
MTHPSPKRKMIPKAVLMRSGLVSLTTARPVNTAQPRSTVNSARPMTNVFNKAHSTVRRPINNKTATKNSNFNQGVNTVKDKNVNTARPKAVVNIAKPKAILNTVKGNQVNAIKASTWQSIDGFIGLRRYVAFGGNPKGGKIISRDTIKTGNLDFENAYFNIDPKGGLTCLFAKATSDESKLWHRRLDDIIFGSTKKSLCIEFEKMMHKRFQMSSIGELTFFLGLQVKQKNDVIFISQDKKAIEIRHHFIRDSNEKKLIQMIKIHTDKNVADLITKVFDNGIGVNAGDSKLMLLGINLLLLGKVNAVRYNLLLLVATIKVKMVNGEQQLQALVDGKKIVVIEASVRRDLQLDDEEGTDCLPNAIIFEELTRMGYEKLSQKLTFYKAFFSPQWKFLIHTILQCLSAKTTALNKFSSTMASAIICLATNQKFNFSKYIFESMVKNLDNASKFLMYPRFIQVFLDNQLEGMSSHKRIYVTPSHTKKIFANMRRQGKDFSGREIPLFSSIVVHNQEEIGEGSTMPTDLHHTPIITQPSSSQPQKKYKSRRLKEKDTQVPQSSIPSDPTNVADEEPSMQLKELMDFCTKLQQRVLDLKNTKTTQAQEITSLKKRVKKLEKKGGSRTHKLKRLYKGRKIDDIDDDINITLVNDVVNDQDMFDVNDLDGEEVFVAEQGVPDISAATITEDEITLAQALAELKSVKPKVTTATTTTTKGILLQEPSESITTTTTIPSKDKGKGIMVEEPLKMKKKDQISFDEQEAIRLQAEFDEEVRLAREKDEANVALIEEWNDIQAKIDADYQMAKQMQAEEQEELSIEEKSKLFVQLLEARKKHFAAKRAEEKRNMPPTRAQQRSIMCTYLKNMAGWKPKDLKNKSFANIQELFDKAMKRVNTFVDMDTELVEGSEVRAEGSINVD